MTFPGCATTHSGTGANDFKRSTATYINGLCLLPRKQRDSSILELNEALLPNHATVSCGRSGDL
jgi:hypothetical protein